MYKQVDFFVYSGTGNTYRVAKTIGEISIEKGISYKINMIDSAAEPEKYTVNNDNLLGLMSPTLGFIQPLNFFKFIFKLPKGEGMSVFLVSTGAWTKIGKFLLPGFIGFGLYFAALILLIKGYKLVGINGIGMPHNWTTFIPPYTKNLENKILDDLKFQVYPFANSILEGKKIFKRKFDLIFGILLFPIPFVFIFFGHLILAKSMFTNHKCTGCGFCSNICPNKAIIMRGKNNKRPFWTLKCEQCMRCSGYCPQNAIEGSLPIAVIFCILYESINLDGYIIKLLQIQNKAVEFAIFYTDFILTIVIGYLLFFLLNKIKIFNRIFTYSSLTFYWRKYRESSVDVKKLVSTSLLEQKL